MSSQDVPTARSARLGHGLAALLYLALVLWVHAAILHAPGTFVPFPEGMHGKQAGTIYQGDQRFVVSAIADTARRLASDPTEIAAFGHCYPLRSAYTLGEHMFGEALLALPFLVATDDPILGYNAAVLLSVWIAALAMYALAFHFTRSVPAALVAGLLFAFHPARLGNPGHPFVHGNLWTPLALLFAHRLFARNRWRDAAGLSLFIGLQLLESFYQVLGLTILGGTFGAYLALRGWRTLPALAPKLLAVALASAGVAWLVLGPYLVTRDTWGVLQGRAGTLLFWPSDYLPGASASTGLVVLALALVGLVDRLRGARRVEGLDPRLVLALGGVLVLWSTVFPFRIPALGVLLPSPLVSLSGWIPGLDAVRVLRAMRFGVYLVLALLAAYGVLALGERLRSGARAALAALLAVAFLVETFAPESAQPGARRGPSLVGYRLLPQVEEIQAVSDMPDGAVLDLPFRFDAMGKLIEMPQYLMLGAYHRRPMAACYNSFVTPLQAEVERLANALPDRGAADALYGLGFRALVVHAERMPEAERRRIAPLLRDRKRTARIARADRTLVYLLRSPVPVVDDAEVFALPGDVAAPEPLPPAEVRAPESRIDFSFANKGAATFRHPTLVPDDLVATWRDPSGREVATSDARGLMPAALAPGDRTLRPFTVAVPVPPGRYEVALSTRGERPLVVARRDVVVL